VDWVPTPGGVRELCCSEFWCSGRITGFTVESGLGLYRGEVSQLGVALVVYPVGERVGVRFLDAEEGLAEVRELHDAGGAAG
jgi:hypothetical protein